MIRHPCPSPDRWRALLADDLPPSDQAELDGHLEFCPACQRTLDDCAADRSTWAVAAHSLGRPVASDRALRDVMDRLKSDPDAVDHAAELPLDFLDLSDHPGSLGRIGHYEVLEEVGRGGMGVVLKALDPALHRVVAIKVLAPQLAVSGTARKRFTREARAAAAIGHENVVTIHAVEEFKGLPYLVMQYIAGPSVQQRLNDDGPLPIAEVLRIGTQTAAGLAAAHAQGLIHRDVKPANILLENGVERVRLTDFSLARAIDDARVTQTGVVTGTPPFMAPEQARGEPLDHRADLFSLGSVLYALCTGRPPFRGKHALDVLRKVSEERPASIRSLNPEVPAWLEAIVMKLMAKNSIERFQSAAEVTGLLERCLAHWQQPTVVPLPVIPGLAARVSRPWRLVVGLAAAAVFGLLAVTVLRIKTDNGTLVVEIDDPKATVTVDGTDIVVTGAGVQEFRLKAGDYTARKTKDGKPVATEVVSIKQGEKTPVKVSFEPTGTAAAVPVLSDIPLMGRLFRDMGAAERERNRAMDAAARVEASRRATEQAAELEKQILLLKLKRQQLLTTVGEKHPSVKEVDQTIELARQLHGRQPRADGDTGIRVTHPQRAIRTLNGGIRSAVFSADGKYLYIGDSVGDVYGYDFVTAMVQFKVAAQDRIVALSPDGKTLAAVGTGQGVQLYDAKTGRLKKHFAGQPAAYHALTFLADGKTLAAGGSGPEGREGLLEIWDLASGTAKTVVFTSTIQSFAVPTGRQDRLAVGTTGDKVLIMYPSTSRVEYSFRQPGPAHGLAFAPDDHWLAAASGNVVRLWYWQAGAEGQALVGHNGRVNDVRFSPDGKHLVTASADGTAKLWDIASRKCVATFDPGSARPGMTVAVFTPDGKSVVTAGEDHNLRVWDLPHVATLKLEWPGKFHGQLTTKQCLECHAKVPATHGSAAFELQVVRLKYLQASDVAETIKKLTGPGGVVTADERTNSLLVHDTAESVKAILKAIEGLDQAAKPAVKP